MPLKKVYPSEESLKVLVEEKSTHAVLVDQDSADSEGFGASFAKKICPGGASPGYCSGRPPWPPRRDAAALDLKEFV